MLDCKIPTINGKYQYSIDISNIVYHVIIIVLPSAMYTQM